MRATDEIGRRYSLVVSLISVEHFLKNDRLIAPLCRNAVGAWFFEGRQAALAIPINDAIPFSYRFFLNRFVAARFQWAVEILRILDDVIDRVAEFAFERFIFLAELAKLLCEEIGFQRGVRHCFLSTVRVSIKSGGQGT